MSLSCARVAFAAVICISGAGCSKGTPLAPPKTEASPSRPQSAAETPASARGEAPGQSRGRGSETAVYVDGRAVGVLRRSELGASMKPILLPELDPYGVPRYFRIYDYLKSVGVEPSK